MSPRPGSGRAGCRDGLVETSGRGSRTADKQTPTQAGPRYPHLPLSSPGSTATANGAVNWGPRWVRNPPALSPRSPALPPGQHLWGAAIAHPSVPPANNACASPAPSPAAQAREPGSNFLRSACSFFPALSAPPSQGIPGSSGWSLFGLTHQHQPCQLIQAEGDDV